MSVHTHFWEFFIIIIIQDYSDRLFFFFWICLTGTNTTIESFMIKENQHVIDNKYCVRDECGYVKEDKHVITRSPDHPRLTLFRVIQNVFCGFLMVVNVPGLLLQFRTRNVLKVLNVV